MGAFFNQADALQAKMGIERRWYTAGPVTLEPGPTPIFSANNWTDPRAPVWLARLRRIAATQNANVQLYWGFDKQTANASQYQGYTDAFPANLQTLSVDAPAVSSLSLTAVNLTTSPITDFQLNYQIEMKRLSVAEKFAFGYGLTAADLEILSALPVGSDGKSGQQQVQDLVEKGSAPLSIDTLRLLYIDNQSLGDSTASGALHATANAYSGGTAFLNIPVKSDEVLIVRKIGITNGASAILYVDRDEDVGYETLTGAAFAQTNPAYFWDVFIPARQNIMLRAYAASSTEISLFVGVKRYRLSDILKTLFGFATSPTAVPGITYAQVLAGIQGWRYGL